MCVCWGSADGSIGGRVVSDRHLAEVCHKLGSSDHVVAIGVHFPEELAGLGGLRVRIAVLEQNTVEKLYY